MALRPEATSFVPRPGAPAFVPGGDVVRTGSNKRCIRSDGAVATASRGARKGGRSKNAAKKTTAAMTSTNIIPTKTAATNMSTTAATTATTTKIPSSATSTTAIAAVVSQSKSRSDGGKGSGRGGNATEGGRSGGRGGRGDQPYGRKDRGRAEPVQRFPGDRTRGPNAPASTVSKHDIVSGSVVNRNDGGNSDNSDRKDISSVSGRGRPSPALACMDRHSMRPRGNVNSRNWREPDEDATTTTNTTTATTTTTTTATTTTTSSTTAAAILSSGTTIIKTTTGTTSIASDRSNTNGHGTSLPVVRSGQDARFSRVTITTTTTTASNSSSSSSSSGTSGGSDNSSSSSSDGGSNRDNISNSSNTILSATPATPVLRVRRSPEAQAEAEAAAEVLRAAKAQEHLRTPGMVLRGQTPNGGGGATGGTFIALRDVRERQEEAEEAEAKRITKATLEREDQEHAQSLRRPRTHRTVSLHMPPDASTEHVGEHAESDEEESSEDEDEEYAPLPVMGPPTRPSASTWVRLLRADANSALSLLKELLERVRRDEAHDKWRVSLSEVFAPDSEGNTVLHECARKGHHMILSTLLELAQNGVATASITSQPEGVDLESAAVTTATFGKRSGAVIRPHMDDLPNELGESLWEDAVREGGGGHVLGTVGDADGAAAGERAHMQMTMDLVAVSNIQRSTPLHAAAASGHISCVRLLLAARASVACKDAIGNRPMHVACKEGHLECVQLLLEQGGSLNQRNKVGNTPLHMAARHGRLAVATTLLKSAKGRLAKGCHSALGSITNTKGRTPLHLAAAKGDVDLLALLLSYRPRLEAVDVEGKTALYCAVERRHTSCLHLLLKAGAGVGDGAKETKGRKEASHHYYYGTTTADGHMCLDEGSCYPLHAAAATGSEEMCSLLCDHGALVTALVGHRVLGVGVMVSGGERNSLHFAAAGGHLHVLRLLVAMGRKQFKAMGRDTTPHTRAWRSFLDAGATTALLTAVAHGHTNCVELLLHNGSDVNGAPGGESPLTLAMRARRWATFAFLLHSGARMMTPVVRYIDGRVSQARQRAGARAPGRTPLPEVSAYLGGGRTRRGAWRDLTAGGARHDEEDETEEEDVCHFEPLLLALSTAGQTGDVSFVVQGGTRVHGHACILAARSEYFRALLFGGSSESYVYSSSSGRDSSTRPAIDLPSLSVPTAGAVLRYLYTGALELDIGSRAEILFEVVSVANELLLPGLVRLCWRVAGVHGSRLPLASFAFTSSHMAASLHAKLTSNARQYEEDAEYVAMVDSVFGNVGGDSQEKERSVGPSKGEEYCAMVRQCRIGFGQCASEVAQAMESEEPVVPDILGKDVVEAARVRVHRSVSSDESSDTSSDEGSGSEKADAESSRNGGGPSLMAVCETTSQDLIHLLREQELCDMILVATVGEHVVEGENLGEWEALPEPIPLVLDSLRGLDEEDEYGRRESWGVPSSGEAADATLDEGGEQTLPAHQAVVSSFSSKLRRAIEMAITHRGKEDLRRPLRIEVECDLVTLRVLVNYMYGGLTHLGELFRANGLGGGPSFEPDRILRLITYGCELLDDPDPLVRWCCGILNKTLTLGNAVSVLHASSLVTAAHPQAAAGPTVSGMRLLHMLAARFVLQHWGDMMPTPAAAAFRSPLVAHEGPKDVQPSGPQQLLDDALRALGCVAKFRGGSSDDTY